MHMSRSDLTPTEAGQAQLSAWKGWGNNNSTAGVVGAVLYLSCSLFQICYYIHYLDSAISKSINMPFNFSKISIKLGLSNNFDYLKFCLFQPEQRYHPCKTLMPKPLIYDSNNSCFDQLKKRDPNLGTEEWVTAQFQLTLLRGECEEHRRPMLAKIFRKTPKQTHAQPTAPTTPLNHLYTKSHSRSSQG